MRGKIISVLKAFLGVALFSIALWILHRELGKYHYRDIVNTLKAMPSVILFAAIGLTSLNYFIMTLYDVLALRYIDHPIPYGKTAFASFVGYSFAQNIGLSMLSGGTVRYHIYPSWGLSTLEITKVIVFSSTTFLLGLITMSGAAFVLEPSVLPTAMHLPFESLRPMGVILLLLSATYIAFVLLRGKPLMLRGWEIALPRPAMSVSQLVVSSVDWALAASVLYVLLPSGTGLTFYGFLPIFMLAQVAGLFSQVPGGVGVFETAVLLMMPSSIASTSLVGSLVAYRGIYYLLPFAVSVVLLGVYEVSGKKEALQKGVLFLGQWTTRLVPQLFAFMTFLGGAVLLLSGALPAESGRLEWLRDVVPLPVIEASHFLGSLAGAGLLILAFGLLRRLDVAYHVTVLFLALGMFFSMMKGLDYEEAIILGVMLAVFVPSGRHFYRKASFLNERFTPGWMAAVIILLAGSVWVGFFSMRHGQYRGDLWWKFAFSGDASRFLRASAGAVCLMLLFALAKLMRPARPQHDVPDTADIEQAGAIIRTSPSPIANLAFLGDKALHFSESGDAFIMYGIKGRSWVAMGDPVGPASEYVELIWEFREMSDQFGGLPVFYEVGTDNLNLYLDLGLSLMKLGEEGLVPLESFSLEGAERKNFRYTLNKLEKEGCSFELLEGESVISALPRLREISDAWLEGKDTREKRFSLGFFDEAYIRRFPIAIVRRNEEIIAFANIWKGADKEELSIDLMRYVPDSPNSTMEYLFLKIMLHGKSEGFQWFNLGMAPLSGLASHELAPLWNRLGAFLYNHGEHFYNFQGLRHYKEKFGPVWRPRYLASPGGLTLPIIMKDLASLVSGSIKGAVSR